MKKSLLFFVAILTTSFAFSQILPQILSTEKYSLILKDNEKPGIDTIGWNTGTPKFLTPDDSQLLTSQMADQSGNPIGYWFGTNYDPASGLAMNIWTQAYQITGSVQIGGLIAMIGKKENNSNSSSSVLQLTLHNVSANQVIIGGQAGNFTYGEGPVSNALATVSKSINDLNITEMLGFNYFQLPSPVTVTNKFAIAADFSSLQLNGDKSCLYFDTPGNGLGLHYTCLCVNQISPTTCYSTHYASGGQLNVNTGLFAVVATGAGINSTDYYLGMKMSIFPNPADEQLQIDYALQYGSDVEIQLYSVNGQLIDNQSIGFQTSGRYSHTFDVSNLKQGEYLVSLNACGNRLVKTFVKK